MTPELTMLVYSVLLMLVVILLPATTAIKENGLMAQAGSRDNLPEPSVFLARCRRLSANMLENLVMFAAIVLTAHVAGVSNESTVLGAQLFFYGRVAHAIVYAAGLPLVRPLCYGVALVGMIMIAVPLL